MRDYLKKICEANNNTHSVEDTYENVKIEAELILAVCITVDLDVVWHFTLMFTFSGGGRIDMARVVHTVSITIQRDLALT